MSFEKAVQKAKIPEYDEYVAALLKYKKHASAYSKFRRKFSSLEFSENPLDRLRFFEEKAAFSKVCKAYCTAKTVYENAAALAELKENQINLSPASLAKVLNMAVPVSMVDIMETERKASLETEQRFISADVRRMLEEAQRMRKTGSPEPVSAKESFLSESDDPSFGDFDPL